MKTKDIVKKVFRWLLVVLGAFNTMVLFGMRPVWTGIAKVLGYEKNKSKILYDLPMYLCILFFVVLILCIVNLVIKTEKHKFTWILFVVEIVFLAALAVVVVKGAMDYLTFILRDFFHSGLVVLMFLCFLFFLYVYPKDLFFSKGFKLVVSVTAGVGVVFALCRFSINRLTYEPVVYAVGDEYQIVFTTSANCLGTVIVGGTEYYEMVAGSERSFTKVHKISIPMEKLDSAGEYTVSYQRPVYRGPFGAIQGKEKTKVYRFLPVNVNDGINYFCLSDVHGHIKQSVETAMHDKEMDFLVICGDTVSYMPDPVDANTVNKLAYEITRGAKPVIYARGNHEVKGKTAEELYRYAGSENERYYYTFTLKDIFGIVLDLGEDHDDDWWEYSGMAHFETYQKEQLDFLDGILSDGQYKEYGYRLAVCHIPPVFINSRHNHEWIKAELTKRLNSLDIDMLVTGHQHDIFIFEPGLVTPNEKLTYNPAYKDGTYKGYLTDFRFPSLMISKTGYTQTDGSKLWGATSQIGLKIMVNPTYDVQICDYINSTGNRLTVVNPFAEKDYGEDIIIRKEAPGIFVME